MSKACLRCGTVNDSDAKVCKECGTKFPLKKTANPSRTQAGGGAGKSVFCKKCSEQRRIKGKTTGWFTPPGPIDQYEEEWEYYVLDVCNHKYLIRKTGRTRPFEGLR